MGSFGLLRVLHSRSHSSSRYLRHFLDFSKKKRKRTFLFRPLDVSTHIAFVGIGIGTGGGATGRSFCSSSSSSSSSVKWSDSSRLKFLMKQMFDQRAQLTFLWHSPYVLWKRKRKSLRRSSVSAHSKGEGDVARRIASIDRFSSLEKSTERVVRSGSKVDLFSSSERFSMASEWEN